MLNRPFRKAAGLLLAAGGLMLASSGASPVSAQTTGNTGANVGVANTISLSALTASFVLVGDPNASVSQPGAVTMNVKTNNPTGYVVTVKARSDSMVGADPSHTDTIPVSALKVTSTVAIDEEMDPLTAKKVAQRAEKTSQAGDTISNDYSITIPWVAADTYSVILDYVAAAQ